MIRTYGFPMMAEIVPQEKFGSVRVAHFEISEVRALASLNKGPNGRQEAGKYAVLLHFRDGVVMSDTLHERASNFNVLLHATGHVLIAGLGLGMVVHALLEHPNVTKLTVVEHNPDVILLIAPTLPKDDRLEIVRANIWTWNPGVGTYFDSIYFDIWGERGSDDDALMRFEQNKLHRRYRRFLSSKGAWMSSWLYREVRKRT